MSKRLSLLFIGIFTIVLPFLGFPTSWKMFFTVIVGMILVAISFVMRKEELAVSGDRREVVTEVFIESRDSVASPEEIVVS